MADLGPIDRLGGYEQLRSANQSSRGDCDIDGVVVHYTGGSDGRRTAGWLCEESARRSAHFVGYRNGHGAQLVPLSRKAWHAGRSEWTYKGRVTRNCNRYTIGVELANHGLLEKGEDGGFWYTVGGRVFRYRGPEPQHAVLTLPNGNEVAGWWEPFTAAQMVWLADLLDRLETAGYSTRLIGHDSIATGRQKIDPGPLFPWEMFGGESLTRSSTVGGPVLV